MGGPRTGDRIQGSMAKRLKTLGLLSNSLKLHLLTFVNINNKNVHIHVTIQANRYKVLI